MSELETRLLPVAAPAGFRLDLIVAGLARRAGAIASLLALVVAWEAAARSGVVTPFLLPPLSAGGAGGWGGAGPRAGARHLAGWLSLARGRVAGARDLAVLLGP